MLIDFKVINESVAITILWLVYSDLFVDTAVHDYGKGNKFLQTF